MTPRERELFAYFAAAGGPVPLRPLFARVPKNAAYDILERYVKKGWIEKSGSNYAITPAGLEAWTALSVPAAPSGEGAGPLAFEKYLPHLRHVPVAYFRALIFLVYLAVIARQHRLLPKHHVSFFIVGKELRWKSWLAEAVARVLGLDPEACVFYLAHESGRALLPKKNSKGETRSVLDAASLPIVGFDDILRWPIELKKQSEVFLFGKPELRGPNGTFAIPAVPILTGNPKPGSTWQERLGYDGPMLRRTVISHVDGLAIPVEIIDKGDAFLERISALDPAPIPKPRRTGWDAGEAVKVKLLEVLRDRELLAKVNLSSLGMLATAATAIEGLEEPAAAVHTMLGAYLTVIEPLEWIRPDWLGVYEGWSAAARAPETGEAATAPAVTTGVEALGSSFDYQARLETLAQVCDELSLEPEEAARILRREPKKRAGDEGRRLARRTRSGRSRDAIALAGGVFGMGTGQAEGAGNDDAARANLRALLSVLARGNPR